MWKSIVETDIWKLVQSGFLPVNCLSLFLGGGERDEVKSTEVSISLKRHSLPAVAGEGREIAQWQGVCFAWRRPQFQPLPFAHRDLLSGRLYDRGREPFSAQRAVLFWATF